jgi:hypothetical protein
MNRSELFVVSVIVVLSTITGCTGKSSGGDAGLKQPSNTDISFEKVAADASRFNLTVVKPETVKDLNSSDTTRLMAADGQVVSRADAEGGMKSKGATACGLIYRGFTLAGGDTLKLSEIQAGVIEGSDNTHQLILIKREGSQKTFAVYCAKLAMPVTLGDVKTALRGIIDVTYE